MSKALMSVNDTVRQSKSLTAYAAAFLALAEKSVSKKTCFMAEIVSVLYSERYQGFQDNPFSAKKAFLGPENTRPVAL